MSAVEEEDQAGGIPEWVVTFGDMMSLLLTFFIMLVSLSEIKDEERYQAMVESVTRQFGYDKSRANLVPGKLRPRNSSLSRLATMGRARRLDLMRGGDKVPAPVGDHPRVLIVRPGTKTAIGTVILGVTVALWILSNIPSVDGQPPEISESVAGTVGRALEPVIEPLGFDWKIGVGLVTSLAAREVIVGTLGTLYGIEGSDEESLGLQEALRQDLTLGGGVALLVFFAFAMQCMSQAWIPNVLLTGNRPVCNTVPGPSTPRADLINRYGLDQRPVSWQLCKVMARNRDLFRISRTGAPGRRPWRAVPRRGSRRPCTGPAQPGVRESRPRRPRSPPCRPRCVPRP